MAFIPDELILEILSFLPSHSLRQFGYTCKTSFAFSCHEELWKPIFLSTQKDRQVDWRGTWRRTVLCIDSNQEAKINCESIISEALVHPYLNATIDLSPFERIKDSIPRFSEMESEEFGEKWYAKPFILTNIVPKWPAFKKWTIEYLLEQFPSGDATFQIESVEWSLPTYVEYMSSNRDESPLYLFDKDFATKSTMNGIPLEEDYFIPETFREDLFRLLGTSRPDHRWLIVGPKRSGSTFHKVYNTVPTNSRILMLRVPGMPSSLDPSSG
jgi:F-box-like